jgi:hypothetical protein
MQTKTALTVAQLLGKVGNGEWPAQRQRGRILCMISVFWDNVVMLPFLCGNVVMLPFCGLS